MPAGRQIAVEDPEWGRRQRRLRQEAAEWANFHRRVIEEAAEDPLYSCIQVV